MIRPLVRALILTLAAMVPVGLCAAVVTVIGYALLSAVLPTYWSSRTLETLESQGPVLLTAIERYKQETGDYPNQLTDLVPRYLPTLFEPCPLTTGWGYDNFGGRFGLSCRSSETTGEVYLYDDDERRWWHVIP